MMYSWRIKLAGENTYPPEEDHSNNLCNFWWLSMICDVFLQSSVEVKRFRVRIFLWIVSCLHSGKRLKIELWITYFDIFYKTSEYCTGCDLFVFQFPVQLRLWQTRPRQVPGAQVSHSWLWRVRTRHGQLLLPQVPLRVPQGQQAQVQTQGRGGGWTIEVSVSRLRNGWRLETIQFPSYNCKTSITEHLTATNKWTKFHSAEHQNHIWNICGKMISRDVFGSRCRIISILYENLDHWCKVLPGSPELARS